MFEEYVFYARLLDSNVLAIVPERKEGYLPLFIDPNSPVAWGVVSAEYLQDRCEEVTQERAEQIHPALFERMREDLNREGEA